MFGLIRSVSLAAFVVLSFGGCKTLEQGESETLFYGKSVVPGFLTYTSQVLLRKEPEEFNEEDYLEDGDSFQDALSAALDQETYTQSAFLRHKGFADMPMTPGGRPKITILGAEFREGEPAAEGEERVGRGVVISYRAVLKVASDKRRFKSASDHPVVRFVLPLDGEALYDKNVKNPNDKNRKAQPCSKDADHPNFTDFFYFWDPTLPGCKVDPDKDLVKVRGDLSMTESTSRTYPEYKLLLDGHSADNPLLVTIVVGVNNSQVASDLGVQKFHEIHGYYDNLATRQSNLKVVQNEIYSKEYAFDNVTVYPGHTVPVTLRIVSMDQREYKVFFPFVADVLTKSDVVVYSGHSGLGKNFRISCPRGYATCIENYMPDGEEFQMPKGKYQIVYFNGCSSWAYYNQQFFDHKADDGIDPNGTKYFDAVTNGLPAYFKDGKETTTLFLERLLFSGKAPTWQEIVNWQGDMPHYPAITHGRITDSWTIIDGDEDNPTTPPR